MGIPRALAVWQLLSRHSLLDVTMIKQNVLTLLGCSSSLAVALWVAPPASASTAVSKTVGDPISESALPAAVETDTNPIMDALTCSCARCFMGQQANL